MRRLPFVPTLVVAAAVAAMLGLGVWQLLRAEWKSEMLTRLEAAPTLPPVELNRDSPSGLEYRKAVARCWISPGETLVRGGRSRDGLAGFVHFIACHDPGSGARLAILDAGWSPGPSTVKNTETSELVTGILRKSGSWEVIPMASYVLVLDKPLAGLEPSAQPSAEAIPNNHRLYAIQWFSFAAIAAFIYFLVLRRRQRR